MTSTNGQAMPDDQWLTTQDLCALIGIKQSTAEAWRSKGLGPPHTKYGRGRTSPVRYSKQAVLAWLSQNQKSSTSSEPRP
jgi:predicted DNA-binding transcriptional regulator AlpA